MKITKQIAGFFCIKNIIVNISPNETEQLPNKILWKTVCVIDTMLEMKFFLFSILFLPEVTEMSKCHSRERERERESANARKQEQKFEFQSTI